ncbi:helix-turn-helix domain-containing protein [Arthrobacter sp. QXT-31]|uniref:helix-turn-helix domain-containing protein n=1 Tax=Arthrobacter sp. QXT-31 TaxID=1357915 RepID=UPI0009717864|nr:helix-turn-helix transcriptional regulator [Arthrobacter sp. QXT-31]APX02922.1 transcriptional regulator [Arthrobacter sp. QXT-31]
MAIVVRIDVELAKRKMSVGEFAERVGITPANVAVLKNGRAKAVRFSTLDAMCRVLNCQAGDLLEWVDDGPAGDAAADGTGTGGDPAAGGDPGEG